MRERDLRQAMASLRQSDEGFTMLEIVVALAILVAAISEIFVLFPMGIQLQQKAEDATHATELGKHIMSEIRGGVRVSTHYWKGFPDRFLDVKPLPADEMRDESRPWEDEIYNGRPDDAMGTSADVDEKAGGRGREEDGDPVPWDPADTDPDLDVGFQPGEGWIGSASPLLCEQVLDRYNAHHPTQTEETFPDLWESGKVGRAHLLRTVMKYRWTAETVDDEGGWVPGFYDAEGLGPDGREILTAQNPDLSFEIFKGEHFTDKDGDRPERKSYLKKVVVRVYWKDGTELNRSTEFISYVANY